MMSERGAQVPVRLGREVVAALAAFLAHARGSRSRPCRPAPTGAGGWAAPAAASSRLGLGGGQLAVEPLDLLLQRGAVGLGLLARLAGGGAADLLRQAVLLGLQRLRFVLEVAHARVGGGRRRPGRRWRPAARRPRAPRRASLAAGGCRSRPGSAYHRTRARSRSSASAPLVAQQLRSARNSSREQVLHQRRRRSRPPPMWTASASANSAARLEALAGIERQRPLQDLRRRVGELPDALDVLAQAGRRRRGTAPPGRWCPSRAARPTGSSRGPARARTDRCGASTGWPRACSGDMKFALPLTMPTCVRLTRSFDFTMPKSASFTSPASDTMMLPGAMSRWTIPSGAAVADRAACARTPAPAASRARRSTRAARAARRCRRSAWRSISRAEIAAGDVLLGHEVFAVDDAEVEHGHDVRVHEAPPAGAPRR